jgi:type IV secretory pathway VirB6-like protein
LSIGWNYADQCPAHWRIPHYLVVAGTIGIVIVAIVTIQTFLQFNTSSKKDRPSALLAFGSIGLLVVLILLFLFSIGWFIAGCIWVFRAWNKVQYKNPKRSDYCHSTLYRFAFWVLILTICYILLLSYRIIQRIRQVVKNSKKGLPKPVPTAEV